MPKGKGKPKKRERTFGGGRYEYRRPKTIAPTSKVIDFHFTFEEALELSIAIQGCLLKLNTYKRVGAGLKQGLCLSAKMGPKASRIDVLEIKLREKARDN
jgi:hypothetical protein